MPKARGRVVIEGLDIGAPLLLQSPHWATSARGRWRSAVPSQRILARNFPQARPPLTMKPVPGRVVAPKIIPREYPHPSRHASFAAAGGPRVWCDRFGSARPRFRKLQVCRPPIGAPSNELVFKRPAADLCAL